MKKKYLILLIILLVGIGVGLFLFLNKDDKNEEEHDPFAYSLPTTEIYNAYDRSYVYSTFTTTAGRVGNNNIPRYKNYNSYTYKFYSKIRTGSEGDYHYETVDAYISFDHLDNAYKYQNTTTLDDEVTTNINNIYSVDEYTRVTRFDLNDNTYVIGQDNSYSIANQFTKLAQGYPTNAINVKDKVGQIADWRIFQDKAGQLYLKKYYASETTVWEIEIYFENYLMVMYRESVVVNGEEIKNIKIQMCYEADITVPDITSFTKKEEE